MRSRYRLDKYNNRISIGIAIILFNSFMVQYYADIFNSYALYIISLLVGCAILAISAKRILVIERESMLLWYIAAIVITLSLAKNPFDINTFADFVTFLACIFMCSMSGNNRNNFDGCFRVIKALVVYLCSYCVDTIVISIHLWILLEFNADKYPKPVFVSAE